MTSSIVGSMVASFGSILQWNNANSHSNLVDIVEERQQYSMNYRWAQFYQGDKRHTDYDEGPCDADVLAGCVASSDVHFVDLDPVSYDTYITFTGNTRLVLFYQPSFMDKFFLVESSSSTSHLMPNAEDDDTNTTTRTTSSSLMTRLSSSKTASAVVEPVVGRVNCLENPSLCSRWIQTSLNLQLLTVIPWNPQYPNHSQQLEIDVTPMKDSSFTETETRMKEYGNDASECLWKRFGAGGKALTIRCARNLKSFHHHMQQEQKEEVERW
jgi:hypothetical protein